eukprot:jgi/Chlat1/25/ChrspC230497S00735
MEPTSPRTRRSVLRICAALVALTTACLIIEAAANSHLFSVARLLNFSKGAAHAVPLIHANVTDPRYAGLLELNDAAQQVAGVYVDRHVPHLARTVVLLSANMAYLDLLINWVCCMRRLHEGIKFMVLTQDRQLHRHLRQNTTLISVDGTLLGVNSTSSYSNLDTPDFIQITFMKLKAVHSLLELGYDVLFTDADICWLEDPLQYIRPDISFQFSTDFVGNWSSMMADYSAPFGSFVVNTGFYFMKALPQTATFLADVKLNCCSTGNDQSVLNRVLNQWLGSKLAVQIPTNAGNVSMYVTAQGLRPDNVLSAQYLDPVCFPSGQDFFYHRKPEWMRASRKLNKTAVAVHVTWTIGHDAKVATLRTAKMWHVGENMAGELNCDT